jgi:hypothetical protein
MLRLLGPRTCSSRGMIRKKDHTCLLITGHPDVFEISFEPPFLCLLVNRPGNEWSSRQTLLNYNIVQASCLLRQRYWAQCNNARGA